KHLAIALARRAQHHSQQVGTKARAVGLNHPGALAEIDLNFFPWGDLHPSKRQGSRLTKRAHEALHRIVATVKTMLADQILIESLGGKAAFESNLDDGSKRFTSTAASRYRAGG